MKYILTITCPFNDMFQGNGRQFTINEPKLRFYLRNVPAEQLSTLIEAIQEKGYTIESMQDDNSFD